VEKSASWSAAAVWLLMLTLWQRTKPKRRATASRKRSSECSVIDDGDGHALQSDYKKEAQCLHNTR
jgi:hypothetical protein